MKNLTLGLTFLLLIGAQAANASSNTVPLTLTMYHDFYNASAGEKPGWGSASGDAIVEFDLEVGTPSGFAYSNSDGEVCVGYQYDQTFTASPIVQTSSAGVKSVLQQSARVQWYNTVCDGNLAYGDLYLTSTAEMNGKKWIARTFLSFLSAEDVMDRSFWIIAEAVADPLEPAVDLGDGIFFGGAAADLSYQY